VRYARNGRKKKYFFQQKKPENRVRRGTDAGRHCQQVKGGERGEFLTKTAEENSQRREFPLNRGENP